MRVRLLFPGGFPFKIWHNISSILPQLKAYSTAFSDAGLMSDQAKTKYLFLKPFTDGRTVSRRDLELQTSNARSHAAHITHQRSRSAPTAHGGRQPGRCRSKTTEHRPARSSTLSPQSIAGQYDIGRMCIGKVPSPITAVPDPFSTYPHPLTKESAGLALYFDTLWTGLATKAVSSSRLQLATRNMSAQDIMSICMQDQLVHEAFTAAMAMRMVSVHNMTVKGRTADHAAGRAIASLRTRLSSHRDLDGKLFLSIMFLAGYEMYAYNFTGCRTHLKLLREMDARSVLDDFQMSYIHNLDVFCASATLCAPVFPVEGSIASSPSEDGLANTFGSAFTQHFTVLGSTLAESIIPSIADCAYAARLCRQCFPTTTMAEWNSMIKSVVRSCSRPTSRLLSYKPTSSAQEAVIIALLILLSYLPVGTLSASASEVFRSLIPSREGLLLKTLHHWDDSDAGLRLWVASIGLVFSIETATTQGFAKVVSDLRRTLDLDQKATERLLNSYLWMDCSGLLRCGGGNLDLLYDR